MNANKTEMCLKKKWPISTSSSKPLKLIDNFTYLDSNLSSTKNDVNICQVMGWTAINRLSILWTSNLSDNIKQHFFKGLAVNTTV